MRAGIFAGSIAALIAGACALPATSVAQPIGTDVPISVTIVNPCNGENVTVNGLDHLVTNAVTDGSGGMNVTTHENIHVTGSGDQGNSYLADQSDLLSGHGDPGSVMTLETSFTLVGKGSVPNLIVHELYHQTVNPDGTITTTVGGISQTCSG